MKKATKAILLTFLITLAFAISSIAQCEAKKIALTTGTATISGNTGSCHNYKFSVATGKRIRVALSSADGRARFDLYWDAAEDETGTELFENQTSLNEVLEFPYWRIDIKGTDRAAFTLKITVTDK